MGDGRCGPPPTAPHSTLTAPATSPPLLISSPCKAPTPHSTLTCTSHFSTAPLASAGLMRVLYGMTSPSMDTMPVMSSLASNLTGGGEGRDGGGAGINKGGGGEKGSGVWREGDGGGISLS